MTKLHDKMRLMQYTYITALQRQIALNVSAFNNLRGFLLSKAQPKNAIITPPLNLEMIASKQACFINQTNIFI
jgi:hypothetical protein